MGLAASQARLLLLTAKNDALEFAAQKVEQERLLLAQEQETIAQEYSDATSNTIYVTRVTTADGTTSQETMTLETLANAMAPMGGEGKMVLIADANGNPIVAAKAVWDEDSNGWTQEYYSIDDGKNMTPLTGGADNEIIRALNSNGVNNVLQAGLQNGAYQLLIQNTAEVIEEGDEAYKTTDIYTLNGKTLHFDQKSPESLSEVSSRYYTEDDAAAQAKYNTAMAKVNTLDTRLENKLNQIETQKKAVEQEMESVDSIIQSNIERTFQYFS